MIATLLLLACQATDGWANVTAGVGGETWGYAGVCLLAAAPDRDEVIAGVSEAGLWSSADGGVTWKKLPGSAGIRHRTHQVVFDPKDARRYWAAGNYGPGIWRTDDAGATFKRLGKLEHVDGIGIDFSDPARRTMLAGLHEQVRSLHLSKDGGETWEKIGERLPEDSNHSTDPMILDSKTFLVNTAGWAKGKAHGIFRSTDAGATWTKVSGLGPAARGLAAGDAVYWQTVWGGGLAKSADRGATWTKLAGPVKTAVVELPGGRLAGLAERQIHVSSDGGARWEKLGPELPVKMQGVVYNAKRGAFFAWRMSDKKAADTVFRLDSK
jgi:photosystem II stability/assembly factor-like uncharacterized protein